MKNNFDIKSINEKNALIENTIKVLKQEFVGIDKQIDDIMNNVRTWFLFPELQKRPVVINLWGLSGIGKTSLVKRISELLRIEKDYVYFNFAAISETNSWEIEDMLEEQLSNESSCRVFVYDEFQYANTINPMTGEENGKKGLKPFWELLDSGKIQKRAQYWSSFYIYKILSHIKRINSQCQMVVQNGVWVNQKECLKHFDLYDIKEFGEVFKNINLGTDNRSEEQVIVASADEPVAGCNEAYLKDDNDYFFIKEYYLNKIIEQYQAYNKTRSEKIDIFHELRNMSIDEFCNFIKEIYQNTRKGYTLRFDQSLIFVIGNLDEAYKISFDTNPDMSPDQFRKITQKITDVEIKESLQRRFRNEQIARLGNIHIIYPSFSSDNFRELINLVLKSYAKETKDLIGIDIEFKQSLKDILYDEGVYPTHGTRPVFSTVHELVKSYLPSIIENLYNKNLCEETEKLSYSFDNDSDELVVTSYDTNNNVIDTFNAKVNLRLKKLRLTDDKDDEQALCALHESGHFVIYAKLFNQVPEKLVSRTTTPDAGGFLMEDYNEHKKKYSKEDKLKEICVDLGGYMAEKMFFGDDNLSSGARSDLAKATRTATLMVRRLGMGTMAYCTGLLHFTNEDPEGLFVYDDNQNTINQEIKNIIEHCSNIVRATFMKDEWKAMLKESALYLCDNSSMPKHVMQELMAKVPEKLKDNKRNEDFYRNKIKDIV